MKYLLATPDAAKPRAFVSRRPWLWAIKSGLALKILMLVLFSALGSVSGAVLAVAPVPLANLYQDHWTTRDGLPHNTINAITQTAEGYLWFATWEGAARFNGREFRVFTRGDVTGLPDTGLRGLTLDGQGMLAVGARGGVSRYQQQIWAPQLAASSMVNQVLRDKDGLLWLATEGDGIYVRDGDTTIAHLTEQDGLPSQSVAALVQDEAGRVWAATANGLAWINNKPTQALRVHELSALTKTPIFSLLLDHEGGVLIGSAQGLYRAEPEHVASEQIKVTPFYPESVTESILSLLQDNRGDLWLGTTDRGLMRISALGVERLEVHQGLPEQRVISLFQDNEDGIWVGTNGGLMRLRDVPFSSLTEQDGLAGNFVRSVLAHSDGSVWVGSSSGLSHIKDGKIRRLALQLADGSTPSVLSLAEGQGDELWVGTFTHGLLRLDKGQLMATYGRAQGLAANEVRAILPTTDGSVWIGTSAGLSLLKGGRFQTFNVKDGLPGDFIMNLQPAVNGDIWVGTGVGAAIIDAQGIRPVYLNSQDNAEYAFGFYAEPDGKHVWLATDRGLLRYRYADASLSFVGKQHGLPIEKIFQPLADRHGGLWLTTNRGITRISLAQAHQVADGVLARLTAAHFTEGDGMASSQANGGSGPAAALTADGQVWIATALGVARVQPARLGEFTRSQLPVVFEAVEIAGTTMPVQSALVQEPGSGRVSFQFSGLGFVLADRIQYRTRLEGFDEDWILRGQQNVVEYTNLLPGDYVFRVAAAYPFDDWGPHEASLNLTVLPFIWQRPLFWLLLGAAGVLALWLLMRLRLRLLQSYTRALERQVVDKTRELHQQAQAFARQAREDVLTQLPNRRAFDDALQDALTRMQRKPLPLSLLLIDVDHFKQVNDRYSHAVGDQVLKIVADILRQEVRLTDVAARWGGEEFTVLLPETDLSTSVQIAERLRLAVQQHDYTEIAADFSLTISVGLAQALPGMAQAQLLANADQALYQAKHAGRNRVLLFSSAESSAGNAVEKAGDNAPEPALESHSAESAKECVKELGQESAPTSVSA